MSIFVLLPVLALLATGGFAAAYSLRDRSAQTTELVRLRAVKHHVRVHGRDKVVTQYVTLATTDYARPSTVVRTQLVTRPVVQTVHAPPVVQRHLVYVTGKGATVTHDQTVTQTHTQVRTHTQVQTQTQLATETNFETVTQPSTVLESRTVTRRVTTTEPGTTVTVTGAVLTVTVTVTKTVTRTATVTVPAATTTTK